MTTEVAAPTALYQRVPAALMMWLYVALAADKRVQIFRLHELWALEDRRAE